MYCSTLYILFINFRSTIDEFDEIDYEMLPIVELSDKDYTFQSGIAITNLTQNIRWADL